jgi:hypothetical protein
VPPDIDLSKLSHAEKDELILRLLPLIGQLEASPCTHRGIGKAACHAGAAAQEPV